MQLIPESRPGFQVTVGSAPTLWPALPMGATGAESYRTLVTAKHGIPGLKHAMDLNGYYGGPPRLPLSVPTPEARREIAEAFADLKG